MNRIIFIWSFVVLIVGCQSIIDLPIDTNSDLVVVEAWLTDNDSIHTVSISKTVSFSSESLSPPVQEASVSLVNNIGGRTDFAETQPGKYTSPRINFVPGVDYHLEIELEEGVNIISESERLLSLPIFDSLHYDSLEIRNPEIPRELIIVYYPIIYAEDPIETADYYWWQLFRNDTLFQASEEIFLLEDRFFNGNDFRNDFTNLSYNRGDKITVVLNMISARTHRYLSLFKSQASLLTTNQQSSPTLLNSNLSYDDGSNKIVLGIFSIAATKKIEKKID